MVCGSTGEDLLVKEWIKGISVFGRHWLIRREPLAICRGAALAAQQIIVSERVVLQSRGPRMSRLRLQDIVKWVLLLTRHGGRASLADSIVDAAEGIGSCSVAVLNWALG